jgi:transcriptional regulator with XRE-family HTH domain
MSNNIAIRIGKSIKKHRDAAGLTQEQLAEKVGVGRVAVARWEIGATSPSLEMIETVAKILGVHPAVVAVEIFSE